MADLVLIGGGDPPSPGMVWIPGGTFLMGSDTHYPEEATAHRVSVDGFWIDRFTVTNRDFARFVAETGHVTVAETAPDPADYPGAKPEMLIAASTVFVEPTRPVDLGNHYNWWTYVPGADWHHPQGPGSSLAGREDHPVVHVAWADVEAFAHWAGKELPSEAEWEFACRGGLDGATYAWGEEFTPDGRWMANTWQGQFPIDNTVADGHRGTAPGGCYSPNGYGLYDMIGNVWEWTTDWYQAHPRSSHSCSHRREPARRNPSSKHRPVAAEHPNPTPSHERRLTPLRTELLPALPASSTHAPTDRHLDIPSRVPLHQPCGTDQEVGTRPSHVNGKINWIQHRDHHGLRRHLPVLPRQTLRRLGARRPSRQRSRRRTADQRRDHAPRRKAHQRTATGTVPLQGLSAAWRRSASRR